MYTLFFFFFLIIIIYFLINIVHTFEVEIRECVTRGRRQGLIRCSHDHLNFFFFNIHLKKISFKLIWVFDCFRKKKKKNDHPKKKIEHP